MLQAALDNLQRRNLLPPAKLTIAHAEAFVAALVLPTDQLVGWATACVPVLPTHAHICTCWLCLVCIVMTISPVLRVADRHRGYSIKHLTAIVIGAGVGASSLKKKEQQEILSVLQDACAQQARG